MISISAPKSLSRWVSLIVAALAIVTAVVYVSYESSMNAVNTQVVVILAAVAVCNLVAAFVMISVPFDVVGVIQIASAALAGWGLTSYLNNDIANLADLLNGVTIFSGGTGSVDMIFGLIGLFVAIGVLEIVSCFMKRA